MINWQGGIRSGPVNLKSGVLDGIHSEAMLVNLLSHLWLSDSSFLCIPSCKTQHFGSLHLLCLILCKDPHFSCSAWLDMSLTWYWGLRSEDPAEDPSEVQKASSPTETCQSKPSPKASDSTARHPSPQRDRPRGGFCNMEGRRPCSASNLMEDLWRQCVEGQQMGCNFTSPLLHLQLY